MWQKNIQRTLISYTIKLVRLVIIICDSYSNLPNEIQSETGIWKRNRLLIDIDIQMYNWNILEDKHLHISFSLYANPFDYIKAILFSLSNFPNVQATTKKLPQGHISPQRQKHKSKDFFFWPIDLDLPCPLWLTSRVAMTLLKTETSGSFSPMTREGMRGDMISCLWRMYVSMAILEKEITRGKGQNWRKKAIKNIA